MPISTEVLNAARIDPVQRAAELWHALVADITAEPCKYPCLRDDFHDWFKDRHFQRDELLSEVRRSFEVKR